MLPVATVIGLQTGLLLSGAVLTEIVFAWPGMGSYLYEATFNRDFPVLEGGILFLAVVFVLVNLLVDVSYGLARSADQVAGQVSTGQPRGRDPAGRAHRRGGREPAGGRRSGSCAATRWPSWARS